MSRGVSRRDAFLGLSRPSGEMPTYTPGGPGGGCETRHGGYSGGPVGPVVRATRSTPGKAHDRDHLPRRPRPPARPAGGVLPRERLVLGREGRGALRAMPARIPWSRPGRRTGWSGWAMRSLTGTSSSTSPTCSCTPTSAAVGSARRSARLDAGTRPSTCTSWSPTGRRSGSSECGLGGPASRRRCGFMPGASIAGRQFLPLRRCRGALGTGPERPNHKPADHSMRWDAGAGSAARSVAPKAAWAEDRLSIDHLLEVAY